MSKRVIPFPAQWFEGRVQKQSIDVESRTVDVLFYSGAKVRQSSFFGEDFFVRLSMDPKHVRLERLASGSAPVLNSHRDGVEDVIGVIEEARLEGGEARARIRFSKRDDVEPIWQDVQDGILRNVSVGASLHKLSEETPDGDPIKHFLALDWEPHEISVVAVGADPNAHIHASEKGDEPCEVEMRDSAQEVQMGARLANRLNGAIDGMVSDDRTRADIIDRMASAAGIEASTVNQILNGSINCPPQDRLEGFARVLSGVTSDSLIEAANSDGCSYGEEETDMSIGPLFEATGKDKDETSVEVPASPEPEPTAEVVQLDAVLRERARAAAITRLCQAHSRSAAFTNAAIESGKTIGQVGTEILNALETEDQKVPTKPNHPEVVAGEDEKDKIRAALSSLLLHRAHPGKYQEIKNGGEEFQGMNLLDMGCWLYERYNRKSLRGKNKMEMAKFALHTTSDFATILADVINKSLRDAYDEAPRTYDPIVREVSASDFKTIHRVQMGAVPTLQETGEHGEYKHVTIGEGEETYALLTYGNIFGITRKALINDDLNAFTRLPQLFGQSASRLQSDLVWGVITANAAMGDGVALFHANHNNLDSGGGAAITTGGLSGAVTQMALQTGLAGETLNIMARYLIVPVTLRPTALQFIGTLARQRIVEGAELPIYADELTVISEPRLDAADTAAWYVAADPSQVDILEVAFLEGQRGVFTETREGFDIDGVEVRARLDFGTGVIDYRGLQRNDGP